MQAQSYSSKPNEMIETNNQEQAGLTPVETIQKWLVDQLAEQLSLDAETVSITEPLTRYGLDSIDAVTIVGDLEDWLDLELPSTLFWDYPTIEQSSQYLAENYDISGALAGADSPEDEVQEEKSAAKGKGWGFWGR